MNTRNIYIREIYMYDRLNNNKEACERRRELRWTTLAELSAGRRLEWTLPRLSTLNSQLSYPVLKYWVCQCHIYQLPLLCFIKCLSFWKVGMYAKFWLRFMVTYVQFLSFTIKIHQYSHLSNKFFGKINITLIFKTIDVYF